MQTASEILTHESIEACYSLWMVIMLKMTVSEMIHRRYPNPVRVDFADSWSKQKFFLFVWNDSHCSTVSSNDSRASCKRYKIIIIHWRHHGIDARGHIFPNCLVWTRRMFPQFSVHFPSKPLNEIRGNSKIWQLLTWNYCHIIIDNYTFCYAPTLTFRVEILFSQCWVRNSPRGYFYCQSWKMWSIEVAQSSTVILLFTLSKTSPKSYFITCF